MNATPIRAVLVDLDDTIYPQADYLDGAWKAVARAGAILGLPADGLYRALVAVAAEGSARGRIINRSLDAIAASQVHVAPLLAAFRAFRPDRLEPYPGVVDALRQLRNHVPVALVTDGEVTGQEAKLAALGLREAFDVVVFSDRLGLERRKPHPAPFRCALDQLGVPPSESVVIGDRPEKDVAAAVALGVRAIRVRTGEYRHRPDTPPPWMSSPDLTTAIGVVLRKLTNPAQRVGG